MDDELTAISSSYGTVVGGESTGTETPDDCRTIIDKAFPHYLAMGMTYNEYYKEDHTLTIAYREAYRKKREVENENLWLQGAYIYQAIARVSPLFNPFAKHPKPDDYLGKPFPLFQKEGEVNAKSNAVADSKGFAYMQSVMAKVNAKFGKG